MSKDERGRKSKASDIKTGGNPNAQELRSEEKIISFSSSRSSMDMLTKYEVDALLALVNNFRNRVRNEEDTVVIFRHILKHEGQF